MIGYFAAAAVLAGIFTAPARARARRRAARNARKPTWQAQLRFIDADGVSELVRIANEPRGFVFERSRAGDTASGGAGEILETRIAKSLHNAIDLAADIVSEQVSDADPHVRIDLWRYDMGAYARRAVLGQINRDGVGGRIIGQAEVTVDGGTGVQTRNYVGATIPELVRLFVQGQLGLTWEEGLFA